MQIKHINFNNEEEIIEVVEDSEKIDIMPYKEICIQGSETKQNAIIVDRNDLNASSCYLATQTNELELHLDIEEGINITIENNEYTHENNGVNLLDMSNKSTLSLTNNGFYLRINNQKFTPSNESIEVNLPIDDNIMNIKVTTTEI